jgi:ketosteroid isomerase-like protein
MPQENVETARTIYEQCARGDFSWFAELGEDFELVTSRENPDAGVYRGETARRWLWAWVQSFEQLTIVVRGVERLPAVSVAVMSAR